MTYADLRDDAHYYSAQASTQIRYIATAGLAAIWALSAGKLQAFRSFWLSAALSLFVSALGVDLFHYTETSRRLGTSLKEAASKRLSLESLIEPGAAATPAALLFSLKFGLVLLGFIAFAIAFVQGVLATGVPV